MSDTGRRRDRHYIASPDMTQQVIELGVPALFLFTLGRIKGSTKPTRYPGDIPLTDTPVPSYDNLQTFASHPNVLCYDNNLFFRCETLLMFTLGLGTVVRVDDTSVRVWLFSFSFSFSFLCVRLAGALVHIQQLTMCAV